jgi:hypothetical protein
MPASPPHAIEINCARRNALGEVTHLGGLGADGRRWLDELGRIVAAAERGEARYFITRGGQQLGLSVRGGELVTMVEDGWSVRQLPTCDRASGRSSRAT